MMRIPSLVNKFCEAVWEYDAEQNEVYLHYDNMTPEFCGHWMLYDTIDQLYREQYVSSTDMEIWERFLTPEALRKFLDGMSEEEHFYIRFEHTKKGMEWHEAYIQRMEEGHVLIASRDAKEMLRNEAIARAVVPEFDYVCCIDVHTKGYILYYSDANKTIVPQSASEDYHQILETYNRMHVVPEEADLLTKQMQLEYVIKALEEKDEYILYATMQEEGKLAYKKLRFSYEGETKEKILLTRTDVGELMGERKLREKEREKRLQYLDNMPVAFCSTRIVNDENGNPCDFQFVYCNRAHERLEGAKEGELIGKRFYEFFQETDPVWLQYYSETAYQGINHVIRRYSPEIKKHLLIYTFQSEYGYCECVLLDVSERHFLTRELEHSREDMKQILELTTDLIFQYHPQTGEVRLEGKGSGERELVLTREDLWKRLGQEGLLDVFQWDAVEDILQKIEKGEHTASTVVRAKLSEEEKWSWYRMTMFAIQESRTAERKVLGFLQNIDQEILKEEKLQKQAQTDSLTGVLNAGTGQKVIRRKLAEKSSCTRCYNAMFVIDMDNFKQINDSEGHLIGDRVLVELAHILKRVFRSDDVIYRLGGDEFVVFAENIRNPEQSVEGILQRFYLSVEEVKEKYSFFACSIGIFVTNKKYSFEEYYQAADKALYETKNGGKGYYTIRKEDT